MGCKVVTEPVAMGVGLGAESAFVGPLPCMGPEVGGEGATLGELLGAEVAVEGPFSSVGPQMHSQVALTREGQGTEAALVLPHTRVDLEMLPQRPPAEKYLWTLVAFVQPFAWLAVAILLQKAPLLQPRIAVLVGMIPSVGSLGCVLTLFRSYTVKEKARICCGKLSSSITDLKESQVTGKVKGQSKEMGTITYCCSIWKCMGDIALCSSRYFEKHFPT